MDDLLDDIFMNYWVWQQNREISSLKSQAQAARIRLDLGSRDTKERIEALEQQVGELALMTKALLEVLHQNGGVGKEEILAAMARIDAEDGVIDGKVTPERERPKKKPEPGKVVSKTATKSAKRPGPK
jgi:hypothetical protein